MVSSVVLIPAALVSRVVMVCASWARAGLHQTLRHANVVAFFGVAYGPCSPSTNTRARAHELILVLAGGAHS